MVRGRLGRVASDGGLVRRWKQPIGRRVSVDDYRGEGHEGGMNTKVILTQYGGGVEEDSELAAVGLPAVRMSTVGKVVLPSTFSFVPIEGEEDSKGGSADFEQAGGHNGSFSADGPVLIKKVTVREAEFYEEALFGKWPTVFLPKYHGRTTLEDDVAIRIENLTFGYNRPCVMDLKMGIQTIESSGQRLFKRVKHFALDRVTGSRHSGVRLEGLSMYRTLENRRMKGTKAQSHTVSANLGISLQDVLTFFLTDESGVRTDIALRFQAQIEALLQHFEQHNSHYLFIGSSVLLIYDNDNSSPHMRWARALQRLHTIAGPRLSADQVSALTRRTHCDVRMIDFAHTGPLPPDQLRDEGYIRGLKTILTALKAIRSHRAKPIFTMANAAIDAMEQHRALGPEDGLGRASLDSTPVHSPAMPRMSLDAGTVLSPGMARMSMDAKPPRAACSSDGVRVSCLHDAHAPAGASASAASPSFTFDSLLNEFTAIGDRPLRACDTSELS